MESDSSSGQLRTKVYFHRGNFEGYQAFNFSRRVDAVFGFNLGLSCPDYSWGAALAALQDCAKAIARGGGPPLPLVCTTSSRAESVQELLLLEQHGMLQIDKKQTRAIEEGEEEAGAGLEALKAARKDGVNEDGGEGHEDEDEDEDEQSIFLQPHKWGWERVQQSGAMANDVYRKSCWLFGGLVTGSLSGTDGAESSEEEEGGKMSRTELYYNRRQARQKRKNKRLQKRARSGR